MPFYLSCHHPFETTFCILKLKVDQLKGIILSRTRGCPPCEHQCRHCETQKAAKKRPRLGRKLPAIVNKGSLISFAPARKIDGGRPRFNYFFPPFYYTTKVFILRVELSFFLSAFSRAMARTEETALPLSDFWAVVDSCSIHLCKLW